MSKQLHFKSLLLLLAMMLGVGTAWADYDAVYTLDGTITGGTSAYAEASNITQNGMDWSVVGNTTQNPWRIGGKSLTEVDRDITGKTAFSQAIKKITFNHAGTTSDNLIVNSVKLTVASDAAFTTVIDEVTLTPEISKNTAGSFDYTPTSPLTEWATGCYYKFTINVSNSKDSNYGFCPTAIVFYVESSKTSTTTTIDATGITNTNLFTGTSAGQLTATVSAGETTITNAEISWTSTVPGVATVDENGNVTLVAPGSTIIKATYNGDENYLGSSATYELNVVNDDPSNLQVTFDFSANKYNWQYTSESNTYFDGSTYTYTEGDISIGFSGKVRLWVSNGSYTMRFYSDETYGRGKMTLTAADGFVITGVSISGSTLSFQNPSSGTINGGEWSGSAKVLTIEKGSSTSNFNKVVVSYTLDTGLPTPTVTIDATGITNTNVFTGTAAGSLSATVTYNDAAVEGATVTWSGNNDEVATIDASTGAVTLVAAGSVTFTATFAGNTDYNEATATYQMTVTNNDPNANDGSEDKPYTVAEAIAFINTLGNSTSANDVYVSGIVSQVDSYNSNYKSITYWISDDGTTTNQMEVYSGKGLDGADFSSKDDLQVGDIVTVKGKVKMYSGTPEFDKNSQLVSFERPAVPSITVDPATVNLAADATSGEFNYTIVNPVAGTTLTATSEAEWISDITVGTDNVTFSTEANTGEVRTATITLTYGTLTKEVTVTQAKYVVPEENVDPAVAGVGYFVKVTSAADLTAGNYLIVYEGNPTHDAMAFNGGLETLDASNNGIEVTILGDKIPATEATVAATFVLQPSGSLKSASGLYIGKAKNANGLDSSAEEALDNTFAIDDNGYAVITAEGGCTLRYNYASDQLRFRYYKSGQQPIALYKYDATATADVEITITDAGYATYCSDVALDFIDTELMPYVATMEGSEVVFTPVESGKIPAGVGILIGGLAEDGKAPAGTYQVRVSADADAVESILVGVTTDTEVEAPIYVLMNQNGKVGFFLTENTFTVKANTAYLPALGGGARFIDINSEHGTTTGIAEIETMRNWDNENVYNLNGQRMSKPTKGLYIVNGKKIAIK